MPTRARTRRPIPRKRTPVVPEGPARERILVAALQVFAERGFDGARTREIAERAGANLGLINYYFEGKERLWREAVALAFQELRAEMGEAADAQARDAGGVRAQLEGLLRRFVRFVARRPEFMRLMNDEGKRDGPRMRWLADQHVGPMTAPLRALLARASAQGILPKTSPELLQYIAVGAAGLAFSQAPEAAYLLGVEPTSEAYAEAHADALVRIFLPEAPPPRTARRR